MKQWNWKHVVGVVFGMLVIQQMIHNYYVDEARREEKTRAISAQQNNAQPARVPEIRVVAASQDAEGVTQNDLDMAFLKKIEIYTVERVKVKAKEYLASRGQTDAQVELISESLYVEAGRLKLAVVRLRAPLEGSSQVHVAGIVGKELKRVVCVRNSPESVPISHGACADKIEEVFGVRIGA